jgi:UDP-N-acetylglucosamine diphosphorylase/glucosamine-1-phosphate N-acetyltransferase
MHLHFFEPTGAWQSMLPLTYTRPVADVRCGILTVAKKWQKRMDAGTVSFGTESYLTEAFPCNPKADSWHIHSGLLPTDMLIAAIQKLKTGESLVSGDTVLAYNGSNDGLKVLFEGSVSIVRYPWDLFKYNRQEIEADFDLLTVGRTSAPINDPHTKTYGSRIFLEEGAKVKAAVLNAETGAIYLGKNSEVQEGSVIRGSFALGENSVVNMGAKMRGDSSIGPNCKVGGEISNSLLYAHSNKAHDGFLGNAVIGEWCNLGADTNNSNLKNNYANVKMWDFETGRFKDTGLQFCGLIMGDHSKCGINTMFNTGTTVGVSANIFGDGFPRNIIPSFAWGGSGGFVTYQTKQAFETAELVFQRRNKTLSATDKAILQHIFEYTAAERVWEKKPTE